jgi:hypothetical protein
MMPRFLLGIAALFLAINFDAVVHAEVNAGCIGRNLNHCCFFSLCRKGMTSARKKVLGQAKNRD